MNLVVAAPPTPTRSPGGCAQRRPRHYRSASVLQGPAHGGMPGGGGAGPSNRHDLPALKRAAPASA
jgi:hypothetical protein